MTYTIDALLHLREAILGLPKNAHLQTVAPSAKMLKAMNAVDAAPALPGDGALEATRKRLRKAWASPEGVGAADVRDLRDAVWILWSEKEPMAQMTGLVDAVHKQVELRSSTRRNFIEAWIQNFNLAKSGIVEAGDHIHGILEQSSDTRLNHWRQANRNYALFNAHRGPGSVAEQIVNGKNAVDEILASIGFDDPLRASSGYARAVNEEILQRVPTALKAHDAAHRLPRILAFIAPNGKWRFSESKGAAASALLYAWIDGGREPPGDVREFVRNFLLGLLGDPRIGAGWSNVDSGCKAVMLKWLAAISLKAFFELIAEFAMDHQFKYRRAFWSAYIDAKAVDEAWLALGSTIHHSAGAVRELNNNYGRVGGAGVSGNQAMLLLRVGELIFCEWSDNGKLRAWRRNWKNAPKFGRHRGEYTRDEVSELGLPFPANPWTGKGGAADGKGLSHFNPDEGYWQSSAAELIARETGIRLAKKDWMPK